MENENGQLDSWDSFISGSFLKAINVTNEEQPFVVTNVTIEETEGGIKPRLQLENKETKFDFDLNKTNSLKISELGIKSPKDLIGKKIYFKKVLVRNPSTNKEVDGLRVHKVD